MAGGGDPAKRLMSIRPTRYQTSLRPQCSAASITWNEPHGQFAKASVPMTFFGAVLKKETPVERLSLDRGLWEGATNAPSMYFLKIKSTLSAAHSTGRKGAPSPASAGKPLHAKGSLPAMPLYLPVPPAKCFGEVPDAGVELGGSTSALPPEADIRQRIEHGAGNSSGSFSGYHHQGLAQGYFTSVTGSLVR